HLYSVYRKMVEQGKDFDDIYDLLALRVITDSVAHCYGAVGIVHKIWSPMPGRFKDYIAVQKSNMYQSIHTTVMRDEGGPLEIQIRTEEMHRTAEVGIAAHWRYKEGQPEHDGALNEKLTWFRQMREWLQDPNEAQEFLDDLRTDLVASDVYVFTPKGDVKELPYGSTPLDFAYAIHTEIGNHCVGARVNNHIVPLRYNLQQGDVVDILTAKNQQPNLEWLNIVKSSRARTKIRRALREHDMLAPVEERVRQPQRQPRKKIAARTPKITDKTRADRVRIEGATGLEVHFSKCCDPMPGEPIIGYVTRGRISVHRVDCKSFEQICTDKARIVAAGWSEVHQPAVTRAIRVTAADRPNLLADLLKAFSGLILNIDGVTARRAPDEHMAICDFLVEITDDHQLDKMVGAAKQVNGVTEVVRRTPSSQS
ncbi:MAG: bifunctional (p)ppGpp synthetase/guanosine-3',5'-bis(diphosphate) 3'-pyrophosphohydrolase, partial [Candidatus Hydrogenedentes bacterium]|nr:bifunctional (p)ppGpp synthetase/guanosine-3',5'-bis(diphosphate) 3'-pyrophosphohydrolase [Candidatus Hydrogenedentota bacterium]